jgi:hypothetical protein
MRPLSYLRSLAQPLAENWEKRTKGTEMSGNCEERTSWRQQRAMCEVLQFNGTGKWQWARSPFLLEPHTDFYVGNLPGNQIRNHSSWAMAVLDRGL